MACGRASRLGLKVQILGKDGKPRRHHIWDGVPHVIQAGQGAADCSIQDCGWHRPYIDYKGSSPERWRFKEYGPHPATLPLTDAEEEFGERYKDCFICEPKTKPGASVNKQWGGWASLKPELLSRGHEVIYLHDDVEPPSFKHAAAMLKHAKGSVLPEGGLHHAAAAVGAKNVVVLFGHYIGPRVTGYAHHTNIYADEIGCGWRTRECPECRTFWENLTAKEVADALCKTTKG